MPYNEISSSTAKDHKHIKNPFMLKIHKRIFKQKNHLGSKATIACKGGFSPTSPTA
jgi:hypothetical protein